MSEMAVAYFDNPDQVPEPGFYVLDGDAEVDENGTRHESNMKPGKRVYTDYADGWSDTEVAAPEVVEGSEE